MKKRKKNRYWVTPFAIFFVVGSLIILPNWVRRLKDRLPMKVRNLQVQGIKALSALDLKVLSGIQEGSPLFGSWVEGALARVSSNPRVAKVTVIRDVTGQVVIRVAERQPKALVNFDQLYYIDREGKILEQVRPNSPEALNLVVITGPWSGKSYPTPKASFDYHPKLISALELLTMFAKSGGLQEKSISEIHFDSKWGWRIFRIGGEAPILVGHDGFQGKVQRLTQVLQDLEGRHLNVKGIDLDFTDCVVVKLRDVG